MAIGAKRNLMIPKSITAPSPAYFAITPSDAADNFGTARNSAMPAHWFQKEDAAAAIRQQRAAASAKQAEMEHWFQKEDALGRVGRVPPANLDNLKSKLSK